MASCPARDGEEIEESSRLRAALGLLPVGFAFRPTDMELVNHYLLRKTNGLLRPIDRFLVPEVNVYSFDPWILSQELSPFQSGDPVWHFFSPKDPKYPGGRRQNRATKSGSWKATGEEREIADSPMSPTIGKKRTLVFHKGRASASVRTIWTIHEYSTTDEKDPYVLCRLLQKPEEVLLKTKRKSKKAASCSNSKGSVEVEGSRMDSSCFSPITASSIPVVSKHGATVVVETLQGMDLSGIDLPSSSQSRHLTSSMQPGGIDMQSETYSGKNFLLGSEESYWQNNTASSVLAASEEGTQVNYLIDDFAQIPYPRCSILGADHHQLCDLHTPLQSSMCDDFQQGSPLEMFHDDNSELNPLNDWVHLDEFL